MGLEMRECEGDVERVVHMSLFVSLMSMGSGWGDRTQRMRCLPCICKALPSSTWPPVLPAIALVVHSITGHKH